MDDLIANPWIVGIGGGVISSLIVFFITKFFLSKKENKEYDIFNLADEHDERVLRDEPLVRNLRWVNDDNKGLYSIKENGCILGTIVI